MVSEVFVGGQPASIGDQVLLPRGKPWSAKILRHGFIISSIDEFTRLRLFVCQWEEIMGESVGRAVEEARVMISRAQAKFDELEVRIACAMALGEIAYLHIEDLTVFICRRTWFSPRRNWRIVNISGDDCYAWFGQNHSNMHLLVLHLRVPSTLTTPTGSVYTGEECFMTYLYHVIKGSPFTEMACFIFGGDPRRLSEANILFINHGYNTFFNKISGTSMEQWLPRDLDLCRQLIYVDLMSGAIEEVTFEDGQEVDREWILHRFDFETFRIFGFLDDFGMPTARPGDMARRRRGFSDDIQRAFFSVVDKSALPKVASRRGRQRWTAAQAIMAAAAG